MHTGSFRLGTAVGLLLGIGLAVLVLAVVIVDTNSIGRLHDQWQESADTVQTIMVERGQLPPRDVLDSARSLRSTVADARRATESQFGTMFAGVLGFAVAVAVWIAVEVTLAAKARRRPVDAAPSPAPKRRPATPPEAFAPQR